MKSLAWKFGLAALLLASPCAANGQTPSERIASRTYPSVFQAWNPATSLPGKSADDMIALHDLWFASPGQLGLAWDGPFQGEATELKPQGMNGASRRIAALRRLNPHLVILVELRYRDAPPDFFSKNSPYWLRDASGQPVPGWKEGGYIQIDFKTASFRRLMARRIQALIHTGLIDGVMLDWWSDDDARLELVQAIREAIGDRLILVNANEGIFPRTAPFINGTFMECTKSETPQDWGRIANTLRWAEQKTRTPHIDCLETWFHQSRRDLALMRANATLALTQSDGYCLFSDPDDLPTPDHLHDWYGFWDKGLGRPLSAGREQPDHAWRREFDNGTVLYNPMGNAPVRIRFEKPHRSRATGQVSLEHTVAPGDGDILLAQPTHP